MDVSNPVAGRDGQDFVNRVAAHGGPSIFAAKLLKSAKVVRAFNALHTPSPEKIAN
jgi:predicted dinucleotide-binding enzyme